MSSVKPDGIKPTAGEQVRVKQLPHVIPWKETPFKEEYVSLCAHLTVLWKPFFVSGKWLEAPPLARKPKHLNVLNTRTAKTLHVKNTHTHQTKASTSAFV